MPERYIIIQRQPVSQPLSLEAMTQVAEEHGAKVLERVDEGILVEMDVSDVNRLRENHPELVIMLYGIALVIYIRSFL